jgi:hypothetical protein
MNKTERFLKKNSSTILTIIGSGGVILTTVLAVKATPKALELIKEEEFKQNKHLNKKEIIKVAWKPYIPAIIAGSSTIACIVGANYLNLKNQASIMSAYALLDSSYKEYRNKTKEVYGDDSEIRKKVIESKFDDSVRTNPEETLFFDYQSMRFFESTFEDILKAEHIFLHNYGINGVTNLNEYYKYVGLEPTEWGNRLGWSTLESHDIYGYEDLAIDYEKVIMSNGLECWNIVFSIEPSEDYLWI